MAIVYDKAGVVIRCGDALTELRDMPDQSIHCVVTSPPYWNLRDYGTGTWEGGDTECDHDTVPARNGRGGSGPNSKNTSNAFPSRLPAPVCGKCGGIYTDNQLGSETTPAEFVENLVRVLMEVHRVLRDDGTLWLNLGDSYATSGGPRTNGSQGKTSQVSAGSVRATRDRRPSDIGVQPKSMVGIPWRVAFSLMDAGWILRNEIIWHKPNCMPESVKGTHFTRHLVTRDEYENLSGLRYTDERAGDSWAGDMPKLSTIELPQSKAPLSAEREGESYGASKRGTRGSAGKTPPAQQLQAGTNQQEKIRTDSEGDHHQAEDDGEVSKVTARKTSGSQEASTYQRPSKPEGTKESCESKICQNTERKGKIQEAACETEGRDLINGQSTDSKRLGSDHRSGERTLSLLQEEAETDDGSRDPFEQGRAAHEGECGSGMSTMQLKEVCENSDPVLVGCPGCQKCSKYHGYVLHLSAGRCTRDHEHIFFLVKSQRYFYDQEAVKIPASPDTHARYARGRSDNHKHADGGPGKQTIAKSMEHMRKPGVNPKSSQNATGSRQNASFSAAVKDVVETRNLRTVWSISTSQCSDAHFATFPPALVEPCILAGCPEGGVVLDPFGGSGTVAQVAKELGRKSVLIELNPDYIPLIRKRVKQHVLFGVE